MRISHSRRAFVPGVVPLVLVPLLSALLTLAFVVPSSTASGRGTTTDGALTAARARATNVLNSVGSRYVGAAIPIRGFVWGVPSGRHRLALQKFSKAKHRWMTLRTKRVRSGAYRFRDQHVWSPGTVKFRTVMYDDGKRFVSNVITVQVLAMPTPQPAPAPAPATQPPAGSMLPDLRIKDLTRCGKGDSDATGGTCFMIVPSAPFDADFPELAGRKLLKFGVVTLNAGAKSAGPAEIVAQRSTTDAPWQVFQNFYDASGNLLGSLPDTMAHLNYAGDGHSHWHIEEFDSYALLNASGTQVARAEKHGYCLEDDTSYGPMEGQPGVSPTAVYDDASSCGRLQPATLTVRDGLSRGWGDTYPSSLPDQGIDITGLPDGVYTVRVHADALGAVWETDESNNTAEVKVQISGDTVTVDTASSTGGLP